MSNFTIDTDFNPGDEIKITFDISNSIPTTETVDLVVLGMIVLILWITSHVKLFI